MRAVSGLVAALLCAATALAQSGDAPRPGERGGPGLALRVRKALTVPLEGPQVVDNALVLVRDGRIERVAPSAQVEVPADYVVEDLGDAWVMPGMIDLHCHIGGSFDINDMVLLTNPELRVMTSVVTDNPNMRRAIAGGVTTVLYIPGSGTNSGGQGALVKTAPGTFEEMLVRAPGSLKVAQWGNPERWAIGVGKMVENYNLRQMFRRGLAYAHMWEAYEAGKGEKPELRLEYELFRKLSTGEVPVSVHTQVYQVVLMTITMLKGEFGLNVFTDHSTIGGWAAAPEAAKLGVPSIVGPRQVDTPRIGSWIGALKTSDQFQGVAAGWQEGGNQLIGFNTDSPVIPQEELFLQAAMGVRYGFRIENLDHVRGLTVVPAVVAGIADRVGSLEAGKDADLLILSGDPCDPRTAIDRVYVNGRNAYDTSRERRRF